MRVAIGSDHGGFELKGNIARLLESESIDFKDFGVFSPDPADYPDVGASVAQAVANGEFDCGILVCGSGIGMSMTANKVPGIRAALCGDSYSARLSREHNDANVLALGGRIIGTDKGLDIVETWLSTEFSGAERHMRRIHKMAELEKPFPAGRDGRRRIEG